MRRIALGFLLGTIALQQLSELPSSGWSWLLVALLPLAVWRLPTKPGGYHAGNFTVWLAIPIGFLWASLIANVQLANTLPAELVGQDVLVTGRIISIPKATAQGTRFRFQTETLRWQGASRIPPRLLDLAWYEAAPALSYGEEWQLQVRLKPPHGFMNPGGFDYESWLFQQGVRARGYVREGEAALNQRLAAADWTSPVGAIRQHIWDALDRLLADSPSRGLVIALAIGERQAITEGQWEVLLRTGTNHLVAISGLHVGLVAGFAFFLVRAAWRRWPRGCRTYPASKAAAWAALLAALAYSLLAGFSIPTRRALVMITVVMSGILLQRRLRPGDLLALALLAVLVFDPMASLSPGFWLSFGAIAAIFYGMQRQVGVVTPVVQRWWWRWGRVQWVVALGLLPLLVMLFGQASLVSPLANLIAVPWVSLITVPLTLLGTLLLGVGDVPAQWLLKLAALSLDWLLLVMEGLARLPFAQWLPPQAPWWTIICAAVGIAWLLLPAGFPARWVGAVWLLPLVLFRPEGIIPGTARVTVLDVGQGLAVVVETAQQVLVYDTGPQFPSGFNTGEAVLVPFLRTRGIRAIDILVISHGDNDHAGGTASLLAAIPAQRILSGSADQFREYSAEACTAGMTWQWQGVAFELLHPAAARPNDKRNNHSCVLRISSAGQRLLLTGDIERVVEQRLVAANPHKLAAELLVVPHHGSATSSSEAFIDAVAPEVAVFPSGYANRFGFPKPEVVDRYQRRQVRLFSTAAHGALEFELGLTPGEIDIKSYRQAAARYWHHRPSFPEPPSRP